MGPEDLDPESRHGIEALSEPAAVNISVLIPPILPASYRIRAESANPGGCQKEESAGCCRGALIVLPLIPQSLRNTVAKRGLS